MEKAKVKVKLNDLGIIQPEGVPILDCRVRVSGKDTWLETLDGKVIGHQVEQCGFQYYEGVVPNRVQYLRATFRITDMKFD